MIHRRKALKYFAEGIIMVVLENTNFNFTSLIEEIFMQKQPSEIFQKIKKTQAVGFAVSKAEVFDLTA